MACLRATHLCASVPVCTRPVLNSHAAPSARPRPRVCAASASNEDRAGDSSSGVESMFAKELERRQKMAKASATEGSPSMNTEKSAAELAATANPPPREAYKEASSQTPQLDRGRALSSEGLEGLIPRARVLLQLGVTFFLGFLPLIAVVGGLFGALYFGFGDQFVHGGEASQSVPAYVDPYALLLENYNDPYYPTSPSQ